MPFIPEDVDAISSDWLKQVLNLQVTGCQVEDAHSGTTGRAVLALNYAQVSTGPKRLFVKLPPSDSAQQAFVVSNGMGRRETRFYSQLATEVPVRVPHCYHADCSEDGQRYIMLLEHLEDSDCRFRNASKRYSLEYVKSALAAFARLHASYWDSSRFQSDLSWIVPPQQHAIGRQLVGRALEQHASEMPGIFSSLAELYLRETDAIHALWNRGTQTLIHGDVHDGNLFLDGENTGLLDWAVVARGPGMRDVGYFLAGTLSPEDQQKHHLEMLDYYRLQLLEQGVTGVNLDDLLLQYSWHAVYVWLSATVTLAMGDAWQPSRYVQRSLERLHLTLEQLDAVHSLGSNL